MTIASKIDMADLPAQLPRAPQTPAEARARFFNSGKTCLANLPVAPIIKTLMKPHRAHQRE